MQKTRAMGKYNKSQILKNAWRTYKFVGKKKGQSFGECLKATWRLAKLHASIEASEVKNKAERASEYKGWLESKKIERPVKSADYNGYISHESLYGRSFVSGGFCGD